jgi:hypothetical protein
MNNLVYENFTMKIKEKESTHCNVTNKLGNNQSDQMVKEKNAIITINDNSEKSIECLYKIGDSNCHHNSLQFAQNCISPNIIPIFTSNLYQTDGYFSSSTAANVLHQPFVKNSLKIGYQLDSSNNSLPKSLNFSHRVDNMISAKDENKSNSIASTPKKKIAAQFK